MRTDAVGSDENTRLIIAKPLIQEFEHCKLYEYLDLSGLPTIGWGQRIRHGQFPQGITQTQADKMFQVTLEGFYNGVLKIINLSGATDGQIAALTSFAYNIGFGSWHPFSDGLLTSTLLRLYNQGQRDLAAKEFLRWDHVNGVEVPGLLRRRKCEQFVFLGYTIDYLKSQNWMQGDS